MGGASALGRVPEWSVRKGEALLKAGRALFAAGRGRDAERAWLACVAREPAGRSGMEARTELLKLYVVEGRYDDFMALVWQTYDLLPESQRLELLIFRMRVELEALRPSDAIADLQRLIDADPDDAQARAALAAAQGRAKRIDEARANFARALAERPDDVELRERYLALLWFTGDDAGLKDVLAGRTAASEDRPRTWKYLGILAERKRDDEAAARAFARAAELAPSEPEYWHRLSLILYRQGRKAEAKAMADERARLRAARTDLRAVWDLFADTYLANPPRVTRGNLLAMARSCERCRWPREAAAFYREVLRLRPDDPEARAGLGRVAGLHHGDHGG
jgi:tetratricopeptide (TPR) repeat protein